MTRPSGVAVAPEPAHSEPQQSKNDVGGSCGGRCRPLVHCSLRGCSFDAEHVGAAPDHAAHAPSEEGSGGPFVDVEVMTDNPWERVSFRGSWGKTPAAIAQRCFHATDTTVSRTAVQRLFLHVWADNELP